MLAEQNKNIVHRFIEEVQNQHNLDIVEEFIDVKMKDHFYTSQGMPQPPNSVEAFKTFYSGMLKSFPDLKVKINDIIAENDKVVTYKTFYGTHKGEFKGIQPTNKNISVDVIDIFRIDGGKFVEHWAVIDWAALMKQINPVNRSMVNSQ